MNRTPTIIKDAIYAAFRAHWVAAGEDPTRIAWGSQEFDTTVVPDFVRFGFAHNGGTIAALGGGTSQELRRFGIVSGVVLVEKSADDGVDRLNALAETTLAFLEDPEFAVEGISLEDIGFDDDGLVAGWYQINVTAQARYDTIRTA